MALKPAEQIQVVNIIASFKHFYSLAAHNILFHPIIFQPEEIKPRDDPKFTIVAKISQFETTTFLLFNFLGNLGEVSGKSVFGGPFNFKGRQGCWRAFWLLLKKVTRQCMGRIKSLNFSAAQLPSHPTRKSCANGKPPT